MTEVIITITSISKIILAITSVTNTAETSKSKTLVTKVRNTKSFEMTVAATAISLTLITAARK